ncbi:MAG: response regulator [Chitinophagaceae bacterium]|nr:response regulator [Chitinophagaceae bacterium]
MHNKRFMVYLLGIFIATIMLVVFLQYNSNRNINNLIHGNESLINEFQIIGEAKKLQTDLLYIESQIHRTVISEDSVYLGRIRQKEKNVTESLSKLNPLLLTDSTKQLVQLLDSLIEDKLKFSENILTALFTKGQPAAEEMYKNRKKYVMEEIVDVIDSLSIPRQRYLTQLAVDADKSGHSAKEWGIFLAVTAGLACMFTFWYITKKVKRQQQLYDQLNESEKKVREAALMKENFMANMSHEIRTPMNAILGFTNLLQKEPLNEKEKEFVRSIQNSGENLLTIINDVLDFSKIEAGMMRIESNSFSLRGLLHSVQTMFGEKIQQKNLHLTVNVEEQIPDILIGDAIRLTQILVNLVNNSVKFTNTGSIHINVTANKKKEEAIDISFSVKDTGIGIPANKIETIFDRFQQADTDTTRKYGGTGLGLSIVKQLVELQNGTISVSSKTNGGTEFIFIIPYKVSKDLNGDKFIPEEEIQLNTKNIKILVAEDNAMNQNLMKHLLASWDLDFDIVNNGQEVIDALEQKNYSLVLMDIQMPLMDGYMATKKIRNELNNNIPIIAMTAHAMAGEREKCLSYGMNEYISKPIRENELFKIINGILQNSSGSAGKKNENNTAGKTAEYLNLGYLKEISGGNTVFEVNMIEQFLQQTPADLEAMQDAFAKKNYEEASQIAHNLKTSVSFMGLTEKLDPYLDNIENNAGIEKENTNVQEKIMAVNKICRQVFQEAKEYLEDIS